MPADKEWEDAQLTPRGWEAGSSQIGWGEVTEMPAPPDRVLTLHRYEVTSSMYSGPTVTVTERWRAQEAAAVDALITRYGSKPKHW